MLGLRAAPGVPRQLVLAVAAMNGVGVLVADESDDAPRTAVSLTTTDGVLSDLHAVLVFLAHDKLRASSAFQQAKVFEWLSFARDIDLPASAWLFPITGRVKHENPAATAQAKKDIRRALQTLNDHLAPPRLTLLGSTADADADHVDVSLADVVVAFALLPLYQLVLDAHFRSSFAAVNAWFARVMSQPEIRDQVGQVQMCEKMLTAAAATK
jgi:glutathione S-transferase